MKYLVCIDDTDMPGTRGTGWLVQDLCEKMEGQGLVRQVSSISRHQLFVHGDIPYTSHNSAMCFEMFVNNGAIDLVIAFMGRFLVSKAEDGSDPGLCVAGLTPALDRDQLIRFGKEAKQRILSKEDAYHLSRQTGVHLSEHGGTGLGVIGAVAGVGLRLTENDGRYRGWYHLGLPGEVVNVDTLCDYPFIDDVVTQRGESLPSNTGVSIGSEKIKTVRLGGRQVVVAVAMDHEKRYRTITHQEAKSF